MLLTTFHRTDIKSLVQVQSPELPLGTVWDYYGQAPDAAWLAAPEKIQAGDVQSWLRHITTDAWYGAQYTVKDASDATVACCTSACHTACLPLAIGQVGTTISPPLFVWDDARCLTRACCVLATTYNQDAQSCITMVDITAAGLVPMFEQA